ncbi:hypothetical protein LTR48_007641, partial [Friedmanniomyces endolithicus]
MGAPQSQLYSENDQQMQTYGAPQAQAQAQTQVQAQTGTSSTTTTTTTTQRIVGYQQLQQQGYQAPYQYPQPQAALPRPPLPAVQQPPADYSHLMRAPPPAQPQQAASSTTTTSTTATQGGVARQAAAAQGGDAGVQRFDMRISQMLVQSGYTCPEGFDWDRVEDGYTCSAGGHFIDDSEVDVLLAGGQPMIELARARRFGGGRRRRSSSSERRFDEDWNSLFG